ncbi:MAG: Zn-ribbon domain-containing OB-fold protein [Actinobacteria bacterium]|nr:Zn-ribbon domain-containing OB-fold protein [Actinomycetota bacterium]
MADDRDPRFVPIKVQDGFAVIPDRWKVDFRVSAGELSRFYIELKENARLMGTRCPNCGSVYCWPRSWCKDCYVDCEWVEMSGKGKLTLCSRVEISLSDIQKEVPFFQGGVHLDGARYPVVVMLRPVEFEDLHVGMPVHAEFLPSEERTGRIRDFYFVPDE